MYLEYLPILIILDYFFIQLVELTKEQGNDWFRIESTEDGTSWFGMCWHVHNHIKYEFDLQFELPVTYPTTPPEIELPQLDGKTAKMYRGGKICLTDHFFPLWARNVPKFGIVHALLLGVCKFPTFSAILNLSCLHLLNYFNFCSFLFLI